MRGSCLQGLGRCIGVVAAAAVAGLAAVPCRAQEQGAPPTFSTEIRKTPKMAAPQPAQTSQPSPPQFPQMAGPRAAVATGIDIADNGAATRIVVALTEPILPTSFVLSDPYRLVIDVASLSFRLSADRPSSRGLVIGYRYGALSPNQARLVFDLTGPARIAHVETSQPAPGLPVQLVIDLVPVEPAAFKPTEVAETSPSGRFAAGPESPKADRPGTGRPLIMIDPGHGGVDPGATGPGGVFEKDIVLAVARRLQAVLQKSGRYEVRMTRVGDGFVSLDQRVELSRAHRASLFISIHADAISDAALAQNVRGASVYTLSEVASNRQAQALADKENAADLKAGVATKASSDDAQVKSILFDLMKRETQNFSSEFRSLVVNSLRTSAGLAREPARSAAFKVLQQPSAPSALIELGYMSNEQDAALLISPDWQGKVAASIGQAVDSYFRQRAARRASP